MIGNISAFWDFFVCLKPSRQSRVLWFLKGFFCFSFFVEHSMLSWKMNCKSLNCRWSVMKIIMKNSQAGLGSRHISCINILLYFIVFIRLNDSHNSIRSFINKLKQIFYSSYTWTSWVLGAKVRIIWNNPTINKNNTILNWQTIVRSLVHRISIC